MSFFYSDDIELLESTATLAEVITRANLLIDSYNQLLIVLRQQSDTKEEMNNGLVR